MAKKFNVLRDAMSLESQERAQIMADQMLADVSQNEVGEARKPAQADNSTLPNNT